jgi:predicted DNA-binding protein (UPF0251 family)/predicted Fe-Mo cluster-binding NifX family protein
MYTKWQHRTIPKGVPNGIILRIFSLYRLTTDPFAFIFGHMLIIPRKGISLVRPRKCRRVGATPDVTYFKPPGVPLSELNEVHLSVDGYEALRLADLQGLKHEDAAAQMRVSRQTFGRVLSQARQTVAGVLVSGFALRICGGDYALSHEMDAQAPVLEAFQENLDALPETPWKSTGPQNSESYAKEIKMEKIAITSEGPTLDDAVDPRFGRAAGFIVVDPQTLDFEYIDNGASQTMAQGAGIQAAENVVRAGANVLLTGYVGPKAFLALEAGNIKVAQNLEDMTVRQAVERYKKGEVEWAAAPNRMGHGR